MRDDNPILLPEALKILRSVAESLDALAHRDMSGLHVDRTWSDIPYPDDHVAFARDQILGLLGGLREGPVQKPPAVAVLEDLKSPDPAV